MRLRAPPERGPRPAAGALGLLERSDIADESWSVGRTDGYSWLSRREAWHAQGGAEPYGSDRQQLRRPQMLQRLEARHLPDDAACRRPAALCGAPDHAVAGFWLSLGSRCPPSLSKLSVTEPHQPPGNDVSSNVFDKYSGGYEGSFADISAFFGGLDKLIGEPQKDVEAAIEAEHCNVRAGFGASDEYVTANNYGVTFSPHREWQFVADPLFLDPMPASVDKRTGRVKGLRRKVDIDMLMERAVSLIQNAFAELGWAKEAVTADLWEELKVQKAELIALRLYTGPMFMFYNTVLRYAALDGMVAGKTQEN
eukprot:SAG31_NODE_108_length_24741_cov_6.933041_6_plen_310_part_00